VGGFVVANGAIFLAARNVAAHPLTALGLVVSIGGGILAALLIGSLGEWLVHRFVMHRRLGPRALNLAFDLHHRAHHWIQYPPDEYVHDDRVRRVPATARLDQVCTSRVGRALTVALHVSFYSFFAVLIAVGPALVLTGNALFAAVVAVVAAIEIYLFVRVHDAVHHPGLSRLERFRWFRFLDRHHYIHHVDNRANTNFLLPLCDLLMGVLRRELSQQELARWPSYDEARRNVIRPTFDGRGIRIRTEASTSETDKWQPTSARSSSPSRASRT
jgi:sterol desaturase/sphingolipid hydroxylase (fatty acid hydroxylase superfamily)